VDPRVEREEEEVAQVAAVVVVEEVGSALVLAVPL
jgi:hypothetical protein